MTKKKVTDKDFEQMERIPNNRNKYIKRGFNFYLSYTLRVIMMFGLVIIIGFLIYFCFDNGFSKSKTISLAYEEKDSVDYDIKLLDKEDNPFGTGELTPGEYYISDIIDDISTDLNYEYKLKDTADVKYSYYVDVALKLMDDNTQKEISDDNYPLVEKIVKEEKQVKEINVTQNINLDYDYYNKIAKSVKDINNESNSNISGYLLLKMFVNLETSYKDFDEPLKKDVVVEVKIPLLSNQVSIEKVSNYDRTDKYVKHFSPEPAVESLLYVGVILLILDTTLFLLSVNFVIKTFPKKSVYCVIRDGILRKYNRVIVNSRKMPDLSEYNIIDCESFGELLDAQRLLDKPIVYYEIVKKQKCIFVIIGVNDAYKYILKEADVDQYMS